MFNNYFSAPTIIATLKTYKKALRLFWVLWLLGLAYSIAMAIFLRGSMLASFIFLSIKIVSICFIPYMIYIIVHAATSAYFDAKNNK